MPDRGFEAVSRERCWGFVPVTLTAPAIPWAYYMCSEMRLGFTCLLELKYMGIESLRQDPSEPNLEGVGDWRPQEGTSTRH
jgi:hypothetical protein